MDYLGDMSRPIKEELILQVFHFQKQIQHCQILEIHVYYTWHDIDVVWDE